MKRIPNLPRLIRFKLWLVERLKRSLHRDYMKRYKFDIACSHCGEWQGQRFEYTDMLSLDPILYAHDRLCCNHCRGISYFLDPGMGRILKTDLDPDMIVKIESFAGVQGSSKITVNVGS